MRRPKVWIFLAFALAVVVAAKGSDGSAEEQPEDDSEGAGCGCSAGLSRDSPRGGEVSSGSSSSARDAATAAPTAEEEEAPDGEACDPETEADAAGEDAAAGIMVLVEEGDFRFGTDRPFIIPDGEGPGRLTSLPSFYIDRFMVTNERFGEFVGNTSYKTDSEKYGWSFVFLPMLSMRQQREIQQAVAGMEWWLPVEGAYWRRPEGPTTDVFRDGRGNHPATHVSWNDAKAYCRWRGGRLPSEAEWERAAQGDPVEAAGEGEGEGEERGRAVPRYPWGDDLTPEGQHRANIWQGTFPTLNLAEDGFPYTSPVDAFPPQNSLGLRDAVGNAWEWVEDWWTPDRSKYKQNNPRGPKRGTEKTKKGGSFLCHHTYCYRYRPAARTKSDVDSGTSNQGFRCAADVPKTAPRSGGGGAGGGAANNDGKAERSGDDGDDHAHPGRDGEL
ncbi:unnamed protein product [Ectocarpus sp. CCAP 1310/34]|nr:unnamed protein product [Ectocarpus sp. CCAP 1310/34]